MEMPDRHSYPVPREWLLTGRRAGAQAEPVIPCHTNLWQPQTLYYTVKLTVTYLPCSQPIYIWKNFPFPICCDGRMLSQCCDSEGDSLQFPMPNLYSVFSQVFPIIVFPCWRTLLRLIVVTVTICLWPCDSSDYSIGSDGVCSSVCPRGRLGENYSQAPRPLAFSALLRWQAWWRPLGCVWCCSIYRWTTSVGVWHIYLTEHCGSSLTPLPCVETLCKQPYCNPPDKWRGCEHSNSMPGCDSPTCVPSHPCLAWRRPKTSVWSSGIYSPFLDEMMVTQEWESQTIPAFLALVVRLLMTYCLGHALLMSSFIIHACMT